MRCVDVIRALAAPADDPQSAEVTEHLAHCPRCAGWAARDAKLDRLWEATRPDSPASSEWDSVWARVADGWEREQETASPEVLPFRAPSVRPWRRAVAIFAVMQTAAAVLLAAFLLGHSPTDGKRQDLAQNTPKLVKPPVEVVAEFDQGQIGIIRVDANDRVQTTDLALNESRGGIDSVYETLNDWEGNARQ